MAFGVTLAFNGVGASGALSGYSVGVVSRSHPTYITPASYAFGIWGIIYILMGAFVVWHLTPMGRRSERGQRVGPWFVASCAFNCVWIVLFTLNTEFWVWVSTCAIFGLLACLLQVHVRAPLWPAAGGGSTGRPATEGTRHAAAVASEAWAEWLVLDVFFSVYAGWVSVASIVNVAAAAGPGGSDLGSPGAGAQAGWAICMLLVALVINGAIVWRKADPAFPAVLFWAARAISKGDDGTDASRAVATGVAWVALGLSAAATLWRVRRLLQLRARQGIPPAVSQEPL